MIVGKFKFLAIAVAMTASMFVMTPANASVMYFNVDFTQAAGPFDVTATVGAVQNGNQYDITTIWGTVTQNGVTYAISGLITPSIDPGDYYQFNNIIFTTAGVAPFSFNTDGLGFYVSGDANAYPLDPATAFNLWGDGGSSAALATTASYVGNVNRTYNGTYSITPAPEPSTILLLVGGLAGLGWMMRRRLKTA